MIITSNGKQIELSPKQAEIYKHGQQIAIGVKNCFANGEGHRQTVKQPHMLVVGNPGTGKTMLMQAIRDLCVQAQRDVLARPEYIPAMQEQWLSDKRRIGCIVNAADLWAEVSGLRASRSFDSDKAESNLIAPFILSSCAFLDDIGAEDPSYKNQAARDFIGMLIKKRYAYWENRLFNYWCTIITTNLSREMVSSYYDRHLPDHKTINDFSDRINHMYKRYVLAGESYRSAA